MASGGFNPKLVTKTVGVGREASILASEHNISVREGITLDASTVSADADGNKILIKGTVIGKIANNGKFGAYSNDHNDGREVAVGILPESVNLRDGDVITSLYLHGSFIESRLSGLDSGAKTDLLGRFVWQ